MKSPQRPGMIGVAMASLVLTASTSLGQALPQRVEIPPATTTLEGVPTVRIDSAEGRTTRRVLSSAEADSQRLMIRVVDGRFYWASRDNRPLQLSSSGEFTYFSSEPGRYIRLTRLNDKISYVEHVDAALLSPTARSTPLPFGTVTWWGELRVVLGK